MLTMIAKLLTGSIVVLLVAAATVACAGPLTDAAVAPLAAVVLSQTPPATAPQGASQGFTRLPPVTPAEAAQPAMSPLPGANAGNAAANQMLLAARRALAVGDVRRASGFVEQSKATTGPRGPQDDIPEAVETLIRKHSDLAATPADRKGTESYRREQARLMLEQADGLLRRGDAEAAETLANDASRLSVVFNPLEVTPETMRERVAAVRRQSPGAQGAASGVVAATASMTIPAGGAVPTDGRAAAAVYNPAADATRTVPAANYQSLPGQTAAPAGQPLLASRPAMTSGGGGVGMQLYQQAEQALRNHDRESAVKYFREASAYKDELDPAIAQRIRDYLQFAASAAPTPAESPAVTDAAAKQMVLARQVQAEIAQQESAAKALMASDPKKALAAMEQARQKVEQAGLEPAAREQLLRRVDRSVGDMRKFVEENRPRLELDEKNQRVRDDVNRRQKAKVEVEEKLALLVNDYNRLNDEQRYEEARVLAKRAAELDPDNPVVKQIAAQSQIIANFRRGMSIRSDKEEGFVAALGNVDQGSIPFDDLKPYQHGDAKTWKKLSDGRLEKLKLRMRRRSEREVEIEQKLKTPVSLGFENAPLTQVLDHLGKYCQVNIHLDPQGLADEGVTSDTPVTIKLQHEISLKSALNLVLQPLKLNYVIKDEVLKITSEQLRGGEVYKVVYNVADLVVPIPNFVPSPDAGIDGQLRKAMSQSGMGGAPGFGGGSGASPIPVVASRDGSRSQGAAVNPAILAQMPGGNAGSMATGPLSNSGANGPGGMGGATQADFDSLIDLITSTVKPSTWDHMGGPGSIAGFETNLSLVVSQTQEVHEEIVDLLEQLRKLQDLQVTIEVRFITLRDDFFERIGVDFNFDLNSNVDKPFQVFGRSNPNTSTSYQTSPFTFQNNGVSTNGVPRNIEDRDLKGSDSVTVGLAAPGVFSADMDIPFRNNTFSLATPRFGGFDPTTMGAAGSMGFAILSDIEAYFFIQAIHGDVRSNVLQAPKVTLFNGQQAFVSDTSQSPFVISVIPVVGDFAAAQQPVIIVLSEGTFLTVQAVVSNDRRFVRLTVVPFFSKIGDVNTFTFTGRRTSSDTTTTEGNQSVPNDSTKKSASSNSTTEGTTVQLPTFSFVTVTTTVSVPDGGTVLLGGIKRLSEGRNEYGVPMLDKIPYLNRLFKNVGIGRETQSLMMMVTPRIIIQEEEEERLGIGGQ